MGSSLSHLGAWVVGLGGVGLFLVAVLDSSFLYLPFGIDLLMITISANSGVKVLYYAAMATAGSVLGTELVSAVARKEGEKGLGRFGRKGRLESVKRKIKRKAGGALVIAALMPPPFPYRVFVATAAVLQYPRNRLLATTAVARFVRYTAEGVLGILFGGRILNLVKSTVFLYVMLVLIGASILGTGILIYTWARHKPREGD